MILHFFSIMVCCSVCILVILYIARVIKRKRCKHLNLKENFYPSYTCQDCGKTFTEKP